MILTIELEEKLKAIAEHHINILSMLPRVEKRPGPIAPHEQIHFIYPIGQVAGNAVDGSSLVAMQDALSACLNRRVGTVWVGVYGNFFHIWASYRDE